jgi:Adenylate cyclase, family 3 (some proteins contain HAMP domain)
MSVMFIDLAGFTGMSERLGDRIIPLLSRYFDSVSTQIQETGGTIDKFIGDAVMAFWGAPAPNPDHAVDCCRAALACQRAMGEAACRRPRPAGQNPHRHQFRRHVGRQYRIGSAAELHRDRRRREYRKPAGEHQQGLRLHHHHRSRDARLAGDRIVVRELDRLAVYGRAGGLQIYELLAMADEPGGARTGCGL